MVRQSVVLHNADESIAANPVITYDPVALTVTLSNPDPTGAPGWLTQGSFYKVKLGIPPAGDLTGGLRAIDGQTLDPSAPASDLEVGFSVGGPSSCMQDADCCTQSTLCAFPTCDTTTNHCVAPVISFCDDIQPIFVAQCSAGTCHGAPTAGSSQMPAEGLILDTSIGVVNTAIGRVSNESNTGALAGRELPPGRQFGINMPIIDEGTMGSGDPGNSWLLYKLMLAAPSLSGDKCRACGPGPTCLGVSAATTTGADGGAGAGDAAIEGGADADDEGGSSGGTDAAVASTCGTCAAAPPLTPQSGMSDSERAILDNYILGLPMPYPTYPGGVPSGATDDNPPMTLAQLERFRLWIAQGATVQECTCQ